MCLSGSVVLKEKDRSRVREMRAEVQLEGLNKAAEGEEETHCIFGRANRAVTLKVLSFCADGWIDSYLFYFILFCYKSL